MKQIRPNDWYKLLSDDSHWYIIPAHLEAEFEEWAYDREPTRVYHPFEAHRLNTHPSSYLFSNWKEERP